MALIPEQTVEQILAATDLVRLIGDRVALRRVGSRYRGLCPFHQEKTPSFYVDPVRQRYHCFGCGADGSAAGWLMAFENRSFPEALELLAHAAGIPIDQVEDTPAQARARAGREAAFGALSRAAGYFADLLWQSPAAAHARAYLETRGLAQATAEDWQFGWAPAASAEFLQWAKTGGISGRALLESGLASPREEDRPQSGLYARFRDRLMFPIRDGAGRIVGFSGRLLDPESKLAKYVNSPETALFRKGNLLFGLDRARRPAIAAKRILVCEGQLDTIALHQAGLAEAVAPLGTAFTPDHAMQLSRVADQAVLLFDGDAAGAKATQRAAEILIPTGMKVRVVPLPPGEDPDSLLRAHGPENLTARIEAAVDFFDFLYESQASQADLTDPDQRQRFADTLAHALRLISDTTAREAHILRVAGRLGVPDSDIRQRVAQARREEQRRPAPGAVTAQTGRGRADENTGSSLAPASAAARLPEDSLIAHLCLLLLLPGSRSVLLEDAQLPGRLAELPSTGLPRRLLELEFDPAQPASLNRALAELKHGAEAWLNRELAQSPLPRQDAGQLAALAREALGRLEERRLRQQLLARTTQLKSAALQPEQVLELQREMGEIRNRLAKLRDGGLLD